MINNLSSLDEMMFSNLLLNYDTYNEPLFSLNMYNTEST